MRSGKSSWYLAPQLPDKSAWARAVDGARTRASSSAIVAANRTITISIPAATGGGMLYHSFSNYFAVLAFFVYLRSVISRRDNRMTRSHLRLRMIASLTAIGVLAVASAALTRAAQQKNDPGKEEWIQLFNGRNLDGWTPKFAKHDLGENFNDTVRVENGVLEVGTTSGPPSTASSATSSTRIRSPTIASSPNTGSSANRCLAVRRGRSETTA